MRETECYRPSTARFELTGKLHVVIEPHVKDNLRGVFPEHLIERIWRHLDPATGDVRRGEFECVGINAVVYDAYSVRVFYRTKRPDGREGTQFMDFSYFSDMMRCLPVTEDGRVIMIQEHRRPRGEWVQMLPAGGEKKGRALEVLMEELLAETGCRLTAESQVIQVARRFMDDGAHSERVSLLTVDRLVDPPAHTNPSEGIRGIVLVPFDEWKDFALDGKYDDSFCEWFAGRCSYDQATGRIVVRGKQEKLR